MRKKLIIILAILSVAVVYAQAQKQKPPVKTPCANAKTELDLNNCYCNQYHQADAELNSTYQQLISASKENPVFIEKLKAAQRAWIAFRDAQLVAIYPETDDPRAKYGSDHRSGEGVGEPALAPFRFMKFFITSARVTNR